MSLIVAQGLLIPFIGTALGSMMVLTMKKDIDRKLQRGLTGFAAGVMVAASVWSLLIPAIEQAKGNMGRFACVPAVFGFCLGMLFLLFLDCVIPHMHLDESVEGPKKNIKKTTMLVLAVVLHNIPEGMAVGVVFAGLKAGNEYISASGAIALAIGIAIQNFPEGAIISMPLYANGAGKGKACIQGILSGAVEPLAGLVTVMLSSIIIPWMPYLLSFAAGAMIYVVVEELIPEMSEGEHSNIGTVAFMIGFSLMMALDVSLG